MQAGGLWFFNTYTFSLILTKSSCMLMKLQVCFIVFQIRFCQVELVRPFQGPQWDTNYTVYVHYAVNMQLYIMLPIKAQRLCVTPLAFLDLIKLGYLWLYERIVSPRPILLASHTMASRNSLLRSLVDVLRQTAIVTQHTF